jgi:tripartite ATP-independent transporter DctP family solute receptor
MSNPPTGGMARRGANKLILGGAAATVAMPFIGARAQAARTIRLAHHVTTESDQQIAAEAFRDRLAEFTGGAIDVQILPAGQMGGQREIIESVELGTVEMGYGESGLYANYLPKFGILAMPYMYRDIAHWQQVVSGPVGSALADELAAVSGIRIVNWINAGYRDTYLRDKPVVTPADFVGVKIRVPESPVFIRSFAALGATPTPVPAPEMYTALQTGVVDAMEGSPEVGYTFKIFEVTRFLSKTRHILLDGSFAINEGFYQSLSADEREALGRAAQEAAQAQWAAFPDREAVWLDRLAEEGGLIINDIDQPAFQDALSTLQDDFAADAGATELLAEIRAT